MKVPSFEVSLIEIATIGVIIDELPKDVIDEAIVSAANRVHLSPEVLAQHYLNAATRFGDALATATELLKL